MTLRTSLIITGDTSVASAAVKELTATVEAAGKASVGAANDASRLDKAQTDAAASARAVGAAEREAAAGAGELGHELAIVNTATASLGAELNAARTSTTALHQAMANTTGGMKEATAAHRDSTAAMNDNIRSAGTVKAGYQQLGFQMQDVGIQLSMGTDLMRVMAMQGGQLATAIDMIGVKGAGGRLASFFAGPWGAVILTAGAVLGPMVASLWETDEAADAAAKSAERLTDYVDDISNYFERATGKIKETNQQLIQFAALSASERAREARKGMERTNAEIRETVTNSAKPRVVGSGVYSPGSMSGQTTVPGSMALQNIGLSNVDIDRQLMALARSRDETAKDAAKVLRLRAQYAQQQKDAVKAEAEERSYLTGVLDTSLRTPGRKTRERKAPSTAARDEFGRDASDKLASIVGAFDGTPSLIEKTNAKVRELDDLIEDLGRRKPPGFGDLIASAEAAKVTVRNGLIATVAEAFDKPRTLAERATVSVAELDAAIADLQKRKPIDWEKSVKEAQDAKGRIAAALREPMADWLRQQEEQSTIQNLLIAGKVAEAEATQEVLRQVRTSGVAAWGNYEAVLAGVRVRRDEAAALDRVHRRQQVYLDTVQDTRAAIESSVQALTHLDLKELMATPAKLIQVYQQAQGRELFEAMFGDSFAELDRALTEGPVDKASRRMAGGMDTATAAVDRLGKAAQNAANGISGSAPSDTDEIVVTGTRPPQTSVDDIMRRALGGVAEDIADLFGSAEMAKAIGAQIGAAGAVALKGAAAGNSVATLADQLGFGKSIDSTGAQIGGALGSIVGGPVGSIVGAVAGGLIGSAFDGPTRSGYSSIGTDANGNAVSAVSGGRNSEGRQREALTYADAVLDGLARVASGLGGRLGSGLDLGTIGTQGDKYVFDPDGAGSAAGTKFDSLEKAVEAALANAVSKGAVTGLSDAVRKALGSSPDVDKALAEAMKVKSLETLIGGVGGQLSEMLSAFDNEAAERIRLAKSYGIDLLAVEKRNAEDRTNLLDEIMKSRVGSLQSLLDDMKYGDLFEGDANERRSQILAEIEDAKQDATAGVDGAADRLAELYRLLLSSTRENFGTAGAQLTSDRSTVQSGAADIIKRETDRLNAAAVGQKATTDAVVAGNKLLDEMADQLAVANRKSDEMLALMRATSAVVPRSDLSVTFRQTAL